MNTTDGFIRSYKTIRVRRNHIACEDCRHVKRLWHANPEFRKRIVLNGNAPCRSTVKRREASITYNVIVDREAFEKVMHKANRKINSKRFQKKAIKVETGR